MTMPYALARRLGDLSAPSRALLAVLSLSVAACPRAGSDAGPDPVDAGPGTDGAGPGGDASGSDAGSDAALPACTETPEQAAARLLRGMNVDPANPGGNPDAATLRDAGVRWARIEWKESEGYAVQDPVIAALRAGGIRVLLLLDYSSVPGKPASNAPDDEWATYLTAFAAGVNDLAQHYGDGVDAWEVWNEPDLFDPGGAYDPGVPDYHFGTMLAGAADAIRLWSTRPIVAGGLASGNPLYLQSASDAAGGLPTDAVGIHPYGQRAPDDWPDPSWGFGNMSALFDAYLVFGQPLWVTEIGTIDEPLQAEYLENVYTLAAGPYAGLVPVVLWFCWSDAMVPPFGVLYADGTPKPSFDRYRAVAPPWDDACDGVD